MTTKKGKIKNSMTPRKEGAKKTEVDALSRRRFLDDRSVFFGVFTLFSQVLGGRKAGSFPAVLTVFFMDVPLFQILLYRIKSKTLIIGKKFRKSSNFF